MSREALPPVPYVHGVPATYDATTFARTWEERRTQWVEPVHPEPLLRAHEVDLDDANVTTNARKAAASARNAGLPIRLTHAVGYEPDNEGRVKTKDIMEPTGEMTDGGKKGKPRPAMKKVGEEALPPAHSSRLVVWLPGNAGLMAGHWLNNGWDFGVVLKRGEVIRKVNWTQFENELRELTGEPIKKKRKPAAPVQGDLFDGGPNS